MNLDAMAKRLGGLWPNHDPVASEGATAIGWPRRETPLCPWGSRQWGATTRAGGGPWVCGLQHWAGNWVSEPCSVIFYRSPFEFDSGKKVRRSDEGEWGRGSRVSMCWYHMYWFLTCPPPSPLSMPPCPSGQVCTTKTKCWKFETNIPRKGISGPQSQYPHSCLWANNIFPRWVCLFCWRKYVDWSWEYINRSKTHECGNWGWGRAILRKGIYKRNCCCSVGATAESPPSPPISIYCKFPEAAEDLGDGQKTEIKSKETEIGQLNWASFDFTVFW